MDVLLHQPLSSPVALAADARATIRAATVAAAPHEACGLLFGDGAEIHTATIARNVAAEPWHRFEIDPAHLFEAQRRDRAGPDRLMGCWHSHPRGSAEPSKLDHEGVADPAWLWLIATPTELRAWRPAPQGFTAVALRDRGS